MTELMTEQTGGRVTATELTKRHLLVVGHGDHPGPDRRVRQAPQHDHLPAGG